MNHHFSSLPLASWPVSSSWMLSRIILVTLSTSQLLGVSAVALNGSNLEIQGPNGSLAAISKYPNFIICDPHYGIRPPIESCQELASDIFPGQEKTIWYSTWKKPFQLPWYQTPQIFHQPECKEI